MSDPGSMALSGVGAVANALNLVKGFVAIRDEAKVLHLKVELMGLLVEAQIAQSALSEEKRELTEQIRKLEEWDGEKKRYSLTEVAPGSFAYALNVKSSPSEPPHILCSNCYHQGRKSLLQRGFSRTKLGFWTYQCKGCASEQLVDARTYRGTADTGEVFTVKHSARGSVSVDLIPQSVDHIKSEAAFIYDAGIDLIKFMIASDLEPRHDPNRKPRTHKFRSARKLRRKHLRERRLRET